MRIYVDSFQTKKSIYLHLCWHFLITEYLWKAYVTTVNKFNFQQSVPFPPNDFANALDDS